MFFCRFPRTGRQTQGGEAALFLVVLKPCQGSFMGLIMSLSDSTVKYSWYICLVPRVLAQAVDDSLSKDAVGKRIAAIRKKKGLSQAQLASLLNIERVLISGYERGKVRLYGDMIARIATILGVSSDAILGLDPKDTANGTPSLRIVRRLQRLEALPESQQKTILRSLDLMLESAESK